jgi:poly-beta-1,6-N-acetyl-D-glucosamine synthase
MSYKDYVLVTPAKNEQAHIERAIEAVVSQTIRPKKWVIVNDGSVDQTEEIVTRAACHHSFIELVRAAGKGQRNFGSKVKAFQAGYCRLKGEAYDFVGNLDADVSFMPDYYEQVLDKFQTNPDLGVAGGIVYELIGHKFVPQRMSLNSVAGAVQLFRRRCYEDIGGYIPIQTGGIDAAAEIMAKTHGWTVQTFLEFPVYHHRRVSTGKKTILSTRFCEGVTNYLLGYHPLFQVVSSAYRVLDRPYLIGSISTLSGYGWACMKRYQRSMPADTIKHLRSEQIARMTFSLRGALNR